VESESIDSVINAEENFEAGSVVASLREGESVSRCSQKCKNGIK